MGDAFFLGDASAANNLLEIDGIRLIWDGMKNKDGDVSKATKKINKFGKRKKKSRTKARRKRRLKAKLLKGLPGAPRQKMVPSYDPEPSTSSGQCYWLNYLNVFKWHAFHSSPENSSSIYQMPGLHQTSYFNNFQDAVGSSRMDQSFQEDEDAEECDGEAEESDDDIVVTEELMQFLEISMRHKASMKAKKEKAAEDLAKEATSERNAIDDCQHPKEDDSAEKRRLELDILYGRAAPTIHGMETATQLTFNRAVDLFNPPYWPVHPFSIKFQAEN